MMPIRWGMYNDILRGGNIKLVNEKDNRKIMEGKHKLKRSKDRGWFKRKKERKMK